MEPANKKQHTYTYPDLYSEYFFMKRNRNLHSCPEHTLIFVIDGELLIKHDDNESTIRKGEYIFLRKDSRTLLERVSYDGKPFSGVFLGLNNNFLSEFYRVMNKACMPTDEQRFSKNIIELPRNPYMDSMYISLLPYFEWDNSQPGDPVLEIKLMEAVFSLLQVDRKFYYCLFDFLKPWDRDVMPKNKKCCTKNVVNANHYQTEKLTTIQKDVNWLCMFGHPQFIISKKIETDYIQKKNTGTASEIYFEVSYRDETRLIGALFDYYKTFPPN